MSAIAAATGASRPSWARAVRSEWVKFGTLASNVITAIAALAVIVVLAAVLVRVRAEEQAAPSPFELLTGVSWAQLLLPVLGAVFVCSEWSSGTSRVTFLAVPTRWPVLLGKVVVMGAASFIVGAVGAAGALLAGAVGGVHVGADPALAIRLIVGAGAYLAGLAVFAVGVGTIVRNLIASMLAVIGLLWLFPLLIALIPSPEVQRLVPYLPSPAGGLLVAAENPAGPLTPWGGGAVLAAWACAALIGAVLALRVRDV